MRYTKEYKEEVRERLLNEAGSYAKKHGFSSSGVDALASAAGVTIGSLYKHFDSKSDLFAALISAELHRTAKLFSQIKESDIDTALEIVSGYLSMQHVSDPGVGCPLPILAPEVARANDDVRFAFEKGILEIIESLSRCVDSEDRVWTLLAQLVGSVLLARALPNQEMQRTLLNAVRAEATRLLSRTDEN